jgi:hypothetical protein
MCCWANLKHTKKLVNRIKKTKTKWIWAYKVVYKTHKNTMESLHQRTNIPKGWYSSDSKRRVLPVKKAQPICHGIHVYLSKPIWPSGCEKVIRVKCYLNDLIGASFTSAVFTQVYIPPSQHK